jgi:hypothetical protein
LLGDGNPCEQKSPKFAKKGFKYIFGYLLPVQLRIFLKLLFMCPLLNLTENASNRGEGAPICCSCDGFSWSDIMYDLKIKAT